MTGTDFDPHPYVGQRRWPWVRGESGDVRPAGHDSYITGQRKTPPRQPSPVDVLTAANLDWGVELRPALVAKDPAPKKGSLDQLTNEVADCMVVVRDSDSAGLGVVGTWYRPMQNLEFLTTANRIFRSSGASWVAAGSLRGGRWVYAVADLPNSPAVATSGLGMLVASVVVSTTHDSSRGFTVEVMLRDTERMVTVTPEASQDPRVWSKRHTPMMLEDEGEVEELVENIGQYRAQVFSELTRWATQSVPDVDLGALAGKLLPTKGRGERDHLSDQQAALTEHLVHAQAEGLSGTRLGLWLAICEWAEWLRPIRTDSRVAPEDHRLLATWAGTIQTVRKRAGKALDEAVAGSKLGSSGSNPGRAG